jgi:hypothetical protein
VTGPAAAAHAPATPTAAEVIDSLTHTRAAAPTIAGRIGAMVRDGALPAGALDDPTDAQALTLALVAGGAPPKGARDRAVRECAQHHAMLTAAHALESAGSLLRGAVDAAGVAAEGAQRVRAMVRDAGLVPVDGPTPADVAAAAEDAVDRLDAAEALRRCVRAHVPLRDQGEALRLVTLLTHP